MIAFACFSRIPMPRVDWEPRAMRYSMCFFPLIGLVVGLLAWGWLSLCAWLGFGDLLRATGVPLIAVAVTGGIHMDGFADVVDAQSSHAESERKRAIMKDPHVGAFAVIGVAFYLLLYVALASELVDARASWPLLCCLPWMSRCTSGLASVAFPRSGREGMLAAFGDSADKKASLVALLAEWVLGAAFLLHLSLPVGAVMCAMDLLTLVGMHRFARTQFGGMSGDLAGFLLQVAELTMLAGLAIAAKVVML